MAHYLTGLDHTLIGVSDLEEAKKTYEKIGFTITPRGSHIGWGTANYCIMFGEDYIELLGIVDDTRESNGLDKLLEERGEGLLGMAFASSDPEKTRSSLQETGLAPSELLDLKRKLELPEGDVIPEFKLLRLRPEGLSERNLFICHHLTPELIRRPELETHANATDHIKSVVIVVEDPKSLQDYYNRLCGVLNVTLTDSTLSVRVGRMTMIFVSDSDLDLLFPGLVIDGDFPEFPYLIAMTLAVKDFSQTEEYLSGTDLTVQKIANGALRLSPKETHGVVLEFVAS
jgi:catechol 2,3-dioxygenase-like lactoylglutathione lyase family enzyme